MVRPPLCFLNPFFSEDQNLFLLYLQNVKKKNRINELKISIFSFRNAPCDSSLFQTCTTPLNRTLSTETSPLQYVQVRLLNLKIISTHVYFYLEKGVQIMTTYVYFYFGKGMYKSQTNFDNKRHRQQQRVSLHPKGGLQCSAPRLQGENALPQSPTKKRKKIRMSKQPK